MTNVPTTRIKLLNKLQKESHGENKSNIKLDTACNDYKNERLKSYIHSQKWWKTSLLPTLKGEVYLIWWNYKIHTNKRQKYIWYEI